MSQSPTHSANRVLACLPSAELRVLQGDLEPIELPLRMQIERSSARIRYVYFPESGFASVVANGTSDHTVEVGLIGREGMTGLTVVLGADRPPHETFMQAAGRGQRITADNLRRLMEKRAGLRQCLLQFAYLFGVQVAQNCLANARGKIEERLARWLLMAHDRLEGDRLSITQEFLSIMLGVRRPGVTVALKHLEGRGLIDSGRGYVVIVDRPGLRAVSNGLYGLAEDELKRLFG